MPRARLTSQLGAALSSRLTLVCAPAGFGKTALLADWSHQEQHRAAWLSLDAGDNDPARFWRHVIAALDRVRSGLSDTVAPLLSPAASSSMESLASAVVNEVAADTSDVVLVLDDYHLVDAEPVHASLWFMVEHAPPNLHVVLSTRADPPWPLGRMRARGELVELRAADLQFTTDEAAALLRQTVVEPTDHVVTTLSTRTEGWAAGLQLAALSLKGQEDADRFVESFSGSHRYVLDYLTEEVLENQPEPVRAFLIETSVLDRLSGPLCDAVTRRTDGQQLLETIERSNVFLTPLDEMRGWWRYHHLFAELLQVRLQHYQPERREELHRNAALWHEEQGLAHDAVRHAMAAGETEWAARLVERYFDELFLSSEGATVQRWLALLPPELVEARPRLQLAKAALNIASGLVDEVESSLDAAERAIVAAVDEPLVPSVGVGASRLVNLPAAIAVGRAYAAQLRGDHERTIRFASQALAKLGEDEWMLAGIAHTTLAMAAWLRGRVDEAEPAMKANAEHWRAAGNADLAAVMSNRLGRIQMSQARLDTALGTYESALQIAASAGPPRLAAGAAHLCLAEVAYERDELETAVNHVTDGIALSRQFVDTQTLAGGLAILAWIRQAMGQVADAREAMDEAGQIAGPAVADLLNPVPAQRARLQLAQGDLEAAARWTAERGLDPHDEVRYPNELAYLVLARVLLAQNQPGQVLGLLDRLHRAAIAQRRAGSVIEIQTLRALALADTGNENAAMDALADALVIGCPQKYVRVFADEGAPMAALIGRYISVRRKQQYWVVSMDCLGRLAQAFDSREPEAAPSGTSGTDLVTHLSNREREVLRLMGAGQTNREIAAELYVSLDTVKKHVTHILDKLGAANRTEATARARMFGLLD